jgi:ABC-2 type transport system ATP-binding protein
MLTTLLRPTSGRIELDGLDPTTKQKLARQRFGIVFQDPSLDNEQTAYENMDLHGVLYHVPRKVRAQRTEELLKLFELWDRKDAYVKTFSGGMKRRLEIARGFLHTPKILFLDEPTLGLDPQGRAGFWRYIRWLRETQGLTVFMTTHYLDEADQLCDRIAVIDHGKIIALGTPQQLKDSVGGDTLEITVAPGSADLAPLLEKLAGVSGVVRAGETYRVRCSSGESLVPQSVVAATQKGIVVTKVAVIKPTLDEVFLGLTGRAYREEGEVAAAPSAETEAAAAPGSG